ncbi:MAG: DUF6398 domain-containing protein [Prolixibacteraceae bacterium]
MNKEGIKKKETKLLELTHLFCVQNLDQDYAHLCKKLVLKLGRKRNVPFQSGKIEIWAAAIIHAIGSINFLFDKSFEPYVSVDQISEYFGTKKSTVANKSKQIKDLLKLSYYDSDFSTQHVLGNNPFNDLVMVNGLIVPLSSIPLDLQEMVKNERAQGRDVEFTTE